MIGFEGLTHIEKDNVICLLEGCTNRICVSDDPLEVVQLVYAANRYLCQLACDSLVRIEKQKN